MDANEATDPNAAGLKKALKTLPPSLPPPVPRRPPENGRPTREQVHARALILAQLAGHPSPHVTQRDYEQAKLELTGESDHDRQLARLV